MLVIDLLILIWIFLVVFLVAHEVVRRRRLRGRGTPRWAKITVRFAVAIFVLSFSVFWTGPWVIRNLVSWVTPPRQIAAWKAEYELLDRKGGTKSPAEELRRVELIHMIRRRGFCCDEGLRDESIDHSDSLYAHAVRKKWEWEDLFR